MKVETIKRLAAAIQRAAGEHGLPNSFSPGELAREYGGPPALVTGQIGHGHIAALRATIGEGPDGFSVRYSTGHGEARFVCANFEIEKPAPTKEAMTPREQDAITEAIRTRRYRWCRARLLHALGAADEQGVFVEVINELLAESGDDFSDIATILSDALVATGWRK